MPSLLPRSRRTAAGRLLFALLPPRFVWALFWVSISSAGFWVTGAADRPETPANGPKPVKKPSISIGGEYARPGMAEAFAALGVPAVKHYAEHLAWGKMQKSRDDPIDFKEMDRFVKEYQDAGFEDLMLSLKPLSPWASK